MGNRTMTPPEEPSSPTDSSIRKRVGKACDRCRLKKSKCDGSSPCSRCRADNAICVFGERKKSQDKVYPKGSVQGCPLLVFHTDQRQLRRNARESANAARRRTARTVSTPSEWRGLDWSSVEGIQPRYTSDARYPGTLGRSEARSQNRSRSLRREL